ncbi:hypothetical protein M5D96_006844 [Drosophila gunungcola]|uniref:Aminotransferase class I/classII domain-containing protein n=1 Tax=Drosophila gunungcola TaxID=103775 RepID=A0A9P9YPU6_9MUSC|nr:hypothetical protein M5D96_006844 [Drosophila gunungcola]
MSKTNQDRKLKHLFDGGDWNVYQPDILNLGVGAPGTDLLSSNCDNFRKATDHCLEREKRENQSLIFQYGPTSGTFEVRREIATYFTEMFESPMNCEDLMITTGATQGLHLLLSTMIDLQVSPTGGYFIWVRIPDCLDSREFLKYCLEHQKIYFIAGPRFSVDGQSGKQFFRLSIAFYPKEKLVDGAKRLCEALRDYIATQKIPQSVS